MPDKPFTQDDLDAMYDEAMLWQPPQAGLTAPTPDPRALLQQISSQKPLIEPIGQGANVQD